MRSSFLKRKTTDGSSHREVRGSKAGHMTLGGSVAVSRTAAYLRRKLWMWPIVGAVILLGTGWGVRHAIETTMREALASELQTLLNVEVAMLQTWFESQELNAESAARTGEVRGAVYELLHESGPNAGFADAATPEARSGPPAQRLEQFLAPVMATHDYIGYFVADRSKTILAATDERMVGREDVGEYSDLLRHALDGRASVSAPFRSVATLDDLSGRHTADVPVMLVAAPVRDADFSTVAVLAFYLRPEGEFTRILQLGRVGESGETYAVNADAMMVSNSRFTDDLVKHRLLPDEPGAESLLQLRIADPGGNILEGHIAGARPTKLEPTRMARSVTAGESGIDVRGYNDYRGVPVIGAWTWLPQYGIGVTTEVDVAEAYRPLTILRWTFLSLMVLLTLAAIGLFVFAVITARLKREAQKAAVEARQLGQYKLERKIGQGGMGVVYKGKHAMLRRPTAIKMLDVERVNDTSVARFEQEVQITCQLNNPHTVAIYDYGRTPEGVFYYAMEFLSGIDLQQLVVEYGPQSQARVIAILKQACESLYEAHTLGLVHRDVKPANMMLNRRGGVPDFLKVLDFGLVKAIDEDKAGQRTGPGSMTGTPLYMSPEAIQTPQAVDARSDIYAVGAIGYFLLSGRPPFDSRSLVELMDMHVNRQPESLIAAGVECSEELENAILSCLEKSPGQRPQTALDLARRLDGCPIDDPWTYDKADAWWSRLERGRDPRGVTGGQPTLQDDAPAGQPPTDNESDMGDTHLGGE